MHSQPANSGVSVQDFADELDVMPSITLENNVIHNNEGYGVILVKPSSAEYSSPQEACEGRTSHCRESGSDLLSILGMCLLSAQTMNFVALSVSLEKRGSGEHGPAQVENTSYERSLIILLQ